MLGRFNVAYPRLDPARRVGQRPADDAIQTLGAIDRGRHDPPGRPARLAPLLHHQPGDAEGTLEPRASVEGRAQRRVHGVPSALRSAVAVAVAPDLDAD